MEQRLSVLTIGADNLTAMRDFYNEKLGWKPVAENKAIIFYKMNGFLFSICRKNELAGFIGISPEGTGFRPVTLGYNVPEAREVWELYNHLKSKGVKILNEPAVPPFGGLFFYFEDIEGNILEIAYNTFIPLDGNNNATDHYSIAAL